MRIRRKIEAMKNQRRRKGRPSFFRRMQTNYKKEEIFTLNDAKNQGKETSTQEEINNIATYFYTALWNNRRGTREFSERRRTQMISKIKHKISEDSKRISDIPLTLDEGKEATKPLLNKKSPRIDGIPVEFYQEFEYVTEWLLTIFIEG